MFNRMFSSASQVQEIDVNEWVSKLLAAHDDVRAVEKIRERLDAMINQVITVRAEALEKEEKLYDFYYEGQCPVDGDFERFVMQAIDYKMPVEDAERWAFVRERYQEIKAERAKQHADLCD